MRCPAHTTKLSDSLCLICLSPSSVVRHTLNTPKEAQGLPGCRAITMSNMPWSPTPGSSHHLAFNNDNCVDFHLLKNVVLPTRKITGLNPFNLSAYGLSARYPTLKTLCYHKASKDSLPGGWLTFRDGIHTRWTTRPCPAALNIFPLYPNYQIKSQVKRLFQTINIIWNNLGFEIIFSCQENLLFKRSRRPF